MQLSIISTQDQKDLSIDWIEVNTLQGNYVIQSGHAPTVLVLAAGSKVIYNSINSEQQTELIIKQGLLHVTRTDCTLLLTQI